MKRQTTLNDEIEKEHLNGNGWRDVRKLKLLLLLFVSVYAAYIYSDRFRIGEIPSKSLPRKNLCGWLV